MPTIVIQLNQNFRKLFVCEQIVLKFKYKYSTSNFKKKHVLFFYFNLRFEKIGDVFIKSQ